MNDPGLERDLSLVLVTGAGASCPFGANGTKLPQMGEWANALVDALSRSGSSYLEATGLQREMSGPEFEEQLGAFLRQSLALGSIRPLLRPSVNFQQIQPSLTPDVLSQWHDSCLHHLEAITNVIRGSLYDLFGEPSVDIDAATNAYAELLRAIGVSPAQRWVYATTNYDYIGEHVIERLGGRPDWGETPALRGREGKLDVDNLIDGIGRYVPVLHLHGRVGWYRRPTGEVYATQSPRHDSGFGVPIVMLPDPEKTYDGDELINSLWRQFRSVLARAERVLVLGHSLHDEYLLQALETAVQPFDRIAVTVLADEDRPSEVHPNGAATVEVVKERFPGADIIPLRFGTRRNGRDALLSWVDRTHRGGLAGPTP